jgi:hypothetical protein
MGIDIICNGAKDAMIYCRSATKNVDRCVVNVLKDDTLQYAFAMDLLLDK